MEEEKINCFGPVYSSKIRGVVSEDSFNNSVTKISVEENEVFKDEVNRTENTPIIELNTNLTSQVFSNQLFNTSWNSSDSDGDTLAYAILFSSDNGSTFQTLEIDYNDTIITLNSTNLQECDLCKIDIMVSDGINTNSTISEAFSIDNELRIDNFGVVYQNNTERVFKFDILNTFDNLTLNNISWSLDTGESVLNSEINATLTSLEGFC